MQRTRDETLATRFALPDKIVTKMEALATDSRARLHTTSEAQVEQQRSQHLENPDGTTSVLNPVPARRQSLLEIPLESISRQYTSSQ